MSKLKSNPSYLSKTLISPLFLLSYCGGKKFTYRGLNPPQTIWALLKWYLSEHTQKKALFILRAPVWCQLKILGVRINRWNWKEGPVEDNYQRSG